MISKQNPLNEVLEIVPHFVTDLSDDKRMGAEWRWFSETVFTSRHIDLHRTGRDTDCYPSGNRGITKGCTRSTHSGGCEVVRLSFLPGEPRRYPAHYEYSQQNFEMAADLPSCRGLW